VVGGAKRPKSEPRRRRVGKRDRTTLISAERPKRNAGWSADTADVLRQRRPNDGWDDIDKQQEPQGFEVQPDVQGRRSPISNSFERRIVGKSSRVGVKRATCTGKGIAMTSPIQPKLPRPTTKRFPSSTRVKWSKFSIEDGDTEHDIQRYFQSHGFSIEISKIESLYYKNGYDLDETVAQLQRDFQYTSQSLSQPLRSTQDLHNGKEKHDKPLKSGSKQVDLLKKGRERQDNPWMRAPKEISTRKVVTPSPFGLQQNPGVTNGSKLHNIIAPQTTPSIGRFAVWEPSYHSCARHVKYGVDQELLRQWWKQIMQGCPWSDPSVTLRSIPRLVCWFTSEGCSCEYKYSGVISKAVSSPRWLGEIAKVVMKVLGFDKTLQPPTCCNINLYRNGSDCVGWHADDESLFGGLKGNSIIMSLSLGQTRSFQIRLKNHGGVNPNPVLTTVLEHGDIITMEGYFQRFYEHRLPPEPNNEQPRINLTFRWLVKHNVECTLSKE